MNLRHEPARPFSMANCVGREKAINIVYFLLLRERENSQFPSSA
jgi:hypothetical protein